MLLRGVVAVSVNQELGASVDFDVGSHRAYRGQFPII